MPFYIPPDGLECVNLEDMQLGLGELATLRNGKVTPLSLDDSFAFFQAQGHSVGLSKDEVDDLIGQLQHLRKSWDKRSGRSAGDGQLN